MGQSYVIFVDEHLISGTIQIAAAQAGVDIGSSGTGLALDAPTQLQLRRVALTSLAEALGDPLPSATGETPLAGMAAFAMTHPEIRTAIGTARGSSTVSAVGATAEDGKTRILEGIGALIVDDETVDVARLTQVMGLTVLPNVRVELPEEPDAPDVTTMDGDAGFWHLTKLGLPSGGSAGKGVLIGVLDTGIDVSHPDFAGKSKIHFAEFDHNGRLISTQPRDAGDHGTHVASIAAGAKAGVAPGAELAVAAVLTIPNAAGRLGGTLVQIVAGFNWLVTQQFGDKTGVDIVNASLGGSGFNAYLQSAVRNALQLGIPLIAAIGNSGRLGVGNHGSPGNYPEVMGVGATDPQDVIADFSDWGVTAPPFGPNFPVPDLCAPGVDVVAAVPGGSYRPKSGTSMATPVVTGIAALRMSTTPGLMGNPAALFTSLRSNVAPYTSGALGNLGGIGRIVV